MLTVFDYLVMTIPFSDSRAALVIAHPGHELRVYQWLRLARPLCFVLTDGSGHSGKARLDSTTKLLERNGARMGCIYGRLTDREIYSALLKSDVTLFIDLCLELVGELVREEIDYVVGDAIEGYNPAHDVCRFMINAAVEMASRKRKQSLLNFEVSLTSPPGNGAEAMTGKAIRIHLNEEDLSRKLKAAQVYHELAGEVDQILRREGIQAIQTEWLQPVANRDISIRQPESPYYELHGEKQVAAGYYEQVLRYSEHVLPVARALRDYSQNASDEHGPIAVKNPILSPPLSS